MTATFDVTLSVEETCNTLRPQIEAAMQDALVRFRSDCPDRLFEAMQYSLLAGGKRLRPILVLLACEACGESAVGAMPAACAIEMVHTYSLIHDDLPAMDDDQIRRGIPTCHVRFDEATAILTGDGLLTLAFEILSTEIQPPERAGSCCALLASAAGIAGMVGGQMADLLAEHAGVTSVQQLEGIHRRKTGRLFQAAVMLGACAAGAPSPVVTALEEFGRCLGLAFQITDDLLDVVGDRIKMGKEVRKDSRHGKLTYPALLGESESRKKAQSLIEQARRSLVPLGTAGRRLEALANFVLERDH